MATSPLFGWEEPDDTDLVKDGAAAIRTLGNAIDTSMGDLLGGTTGQVLSKASNTDMDFTWVTSDDANAIQNTIVDAKGDLIAASAADTPARLAVGNNGETLVADSSTSTGLRYTSNFAAGKNKVINGDFGIWQRGTSSTSSNAFVADRYFSYWDGSGIRTVSQQTFIPGTAPVAGYEGTYFYRTAQSTAGSGGTYWSLIRQRIEDVRTLAGQTVTLSFWAKADAARSVGVFIDQNFGSGGSAGVQPLVSSANLTTSWQRFTFTFTMTGISGKTIGSGSYVAIAIESNTQNTVSNYDFWGVQLEAGSVATAFQTATGTLQGELAACQRYYIRFGGDSGYQQYGLGLCSSTTRTNAQVNLPVTMRVAPTSVDYSTLALQDYDGASVLSVIALSLSGGIGKNVAGVTADVASGLTTGRTCRLESNNSTSAYLGFSAEL